MVLFIKKNKKHFLRYFTKISILLIIFGFLGSFFVPFLFRQSVTPVRAAVQNYTVNFATSIEGFTYVDESCTGTCTQGYLGTDGNPSGSLFAKVTARNKKNLGYFKKTLTWEDMGVPAGATVNNVNGSFDVKLFQETHASTQSVGLKIYDGVDTTGVFDGLVDLETEFDPTSSSWVTRDVDGAKTVSSAYQASNINVTIRMRSDVNSGNNNSASTEVRMDTLVFAIDYTLAVANPDATSFTNNTDGTITDGGRSLQQITITGTGFGADPGAGNRSTVTDNIKIGGSGGYQIPDADISSWSDTQIVFTIPAACMSYGGVTNNGLLVTAGGVADTSLLTFYVYPNITGVGAGKTVGDVTATITGDHLGTTRTMTINGVSATIGGGSTETSVTFTVPDTISGTVIVSITAPITKTSNNNQNFQILPKVTAISTTSGDSGSTYSGISLTGSGFQSVSSVTLTLGTQTVTGSSFSLSNKNSITGGSFNLNNATPGPTAAYGGVWNVNLTITDAIFGATATTYASSFTVRPKIIAPTPTEALQGATITISGYGFGTAGTLYINNNGTAITESTPGVTWTNTSISGVSVPSDATINTGGMSITVGAVQNSPVYGFTVLPQITSLSVTEARVGDTITINGNHLGVSAGTISINGASATGTWGDISITGVAIPLTGTIDGSVTITTNATYGTKTSNGITFKILPRITSTNPVTGTGARIGDVVVINGDHFGPAGAITLDGQNSSTGVTYADTSISNFTIPATISSGQSLNFVVTRSSDSKTSNSYAFKILPRVTTSLSPTEGRVGDLLTIQGDHFGGVQGTGSVMLGSTSAPVTLWGDTSITVTVPNDAATTVAVQVTRNGGDTSNNNITFTILPQITSITQTEGRVGDTITVNGNHFGAVRGAGTVTFGSIIAPSGDYVSWNAGTIQVKIQNDSSYNLAIKVTRDDTKISNTDKTILILPQITSIVPTDVLVGDTVTIAGNHFGAAKGTNGKVTMGTTDVAGGDYVSWGDNSLQVKVPNDSGGTIAVVTTRDGDLKTSNNDKTVSIMPQVTGISVTEARVGDTITISGNHFGAVRGAGYVTFGSTNAPAGDHVSWGDSSIQVKVQNDSGYTVAVKVTRDDTKSSNTDKSILLLPRIASVTAEARVGGTITLTGDHFGTQGASSQVTVGSTVAGIGTWNEGSITATVPNDPSYTVAVVARRHSDLKDSNNDKTMLILPRVTSVTSESRVGGSVTVSGDHFGNQGASSKITFGSTDGTIGTWSETSITATVPNDSGTTVAVVATRHSDLKTSNNDVTLLILPQLSSISVTEGRVGDTITLTGNHFGAVRGTGKVTFGTTDVPSGDYVSWGANSIQVKIQNDAGYTVAVKVTRDDTKTSNTDKTILILPQITSVNSEARVGDSITISGNHFGATQGAGKVTIGTTDVSSGLTWSTTSVSLNLPNDSGITVAVVVTRDDAKTSNNNYTLIILPKVTSVTSEARVGDSITISGDHFGAVQGGGKVTVGTTDVTAGLTWGATSISFALPNDSGITVAIVVTRNDTKTSNNDKTLLILPRITSLNNAVTQNSSYQGDIITIIGDHFGSNGSVVINGESATINGSYGASGGTQITNVAVPVIPDGNEAGNIVVTRTNPAPDKNTNNWSFTCLPKITSVDVTASGYGITVENGVTGARYEDTLRINGNHFGTQGANSRIMFGSTVASIGSWLTTTIETTAPNDPGYSVSLIARRHSDSVNSNNYSFDYLPRVTGFTCSGSGCTTGVAGGFAGGGTLVAIDGDHFRPDPGAGNRSSASYNIKFNDFNGNPLLTPNGDFNGWAENQIGVYIPSGASSGPVNYAARIQVTANSKTSNLDASHTRFDIKPKITGINPNTAENSNPVTVTITGKGFQPKTASTDSRLVKTGQSDIVAANGDITVSSATSMSAAYNIVYKTIGYWKLTVTNPEGYVAEWGDGSTSGFFITASVPTVTGVDPAEGTQNDTALQLTITGDNFVNLSSPKCYLSGPTQINADTVYEDSAIQIRCVVNLSGKPTGQYSVNVKNQAGVGTLSNGFTILSNVPADPSDLIQSKTQGGAALSPESGINQTNIWFHTDMYSAVAGNLTPEVELKPNGVPFDGNGLILGSSVSYPTPKTTVDGWVQATVVNGNEYHWRIRVKNANGDSAWVNFGGDPVNSKDFYCDTVAPTITGISTSGVSDVSATINWSVNEDATKQVEYNTTGSWPGTLQPNPTSGYSVGAQAVTITGLSPSTTYYFRVKAIDKAGNEAICGNSVDSPTHCAENGSFVTLATRPLKTVELFIGQDTDTRTSGNGVPGGFAFNIYIPEGNPTIKSAFFEITGVSGTANPLVITTDIDSANQKVFNLSTGNNSYLKTYYDATSYFYGIINDSGTYPATDAYHLNIVGNGGDVSLWGAKLTLTYTYSP